MKYIKRFIEESVFDPVFGRQMRFLSGPRQCGKTTLAREKLMADGAPELYFNWDSPEVKKKYRENGDLLAPRAGGGRKWVCFDEIHKMPRWKNILKGMFDTHEAGYHFIITGSARMEAFRRAGDSLAGRYFNFRINPFMLAEAAGLKAKDAGPEKDAMTFIEKTLDTGKKSQQIMEEMLAFGNFPEPLLKGEERFSRMWNDSYFERVIKEDMRDLSALHFLEKAVDLMALLPTKIGAPLSIESLALELELNFRTVKRYLSHLQSNFLIFDMEPYTGGMRGLNKKMRKVYFYNYSAVKDEAARFENFVAMELRARADLWNSATADKYELCFIRNREKKECDFLMLKNKKPYFLCEAKLAGTFIDHHLGRFSENLGGIPLVQAVRQEGVLKKEGKMFFAISASQFFG